MRQVGVFVIIVVLLGCSSGEYKEDFDAGGVGDTGFEDEHESDAGWNTGWDKGGHSDGGTVAESNSVSCPLDFKHRQAMFRDFTFTTGWQPPSAPIQFRFYLHFGGDVTAELPGNAVMSWPERYGISYDGNPLDGVFEMDVGVEVTADMRWNIPGIGSGTAPLPASIVPQFDFLFEDQAEFTPFLLEGEEERPVHIEDTIQKTKLLTVDLVPIITGGTPIPGFVAGLTLLAGGDFTGDLSGVSITTIPDGIPDGGMPIVHTIENELKTWPENEDSGQSGQAQYKALVNLKGDLVLSPGIALEVAGVPFPITPVDIPVPVIDGDFNWNFAPEPISFTVQPGISVTR